MILDGFRWFLMVLDVFGCFSAEGEGVVVSRGLSNKERIKNKQTNNKKMLSSSSLPLLLLILSLSLLTTTTAKMETHTNTKISKIAFGSCSKHDHEQPLWDLMLDGEGEEGGERGGERGGKPDVFAWLGDVVYADKKRGGLFFFPGEPERQKTFLDLQRELPGFVWVLSGGCGGGGVGFVGVGGICCVGGVGIGVVSVIRFLSCFIILFSFFLPLTLPPPLFFLSNRYKQFRNLVKILGVWDDHDYGINDGDKTYAWRVLFLLPSPFFFLPSSFPSSFSLLPFLLLLQTDHFLLSPPTTTTTITQQQHNTTNNKQQTTNNKQQTTNNKQQTTNNKQQTTNNNPTTQQPNNNTTTI